MASAVNKGNGSETATGETPVSSGRPISCIVYILDGGVKFRCFSGLKVSVLWRFSVASWMIGSKVGLTALSGTRGAAVAMILRLLCFEMSKKSLSKREE